jgi:hypothetical protein
MADIFMLLFLLLLLLLLFSLLGYSGQEPEPSQATGMALVRCILGKFSGVVCHCFPLFCALPSLITISSTAIKNMLPPLLK